MKPIVLTVGVFDYFHYGHLLLFRQIKARFPKCYLKVAVQISKYVLKYKPQANIFYPTEVRCDLISSLCLVDEVITYNNVDEIVKDTNFDIFAIGQDQTHEGFKKAESYCLQHGKEVIRLMRTPNISSSSIKDNLDIKRNFS